MIIRPKSIALIVLCSAIHAPAAITIQHRWSLGESGAATDSVGTANLTAVGTTTSVPGVASATAQDFANVSSESPATQYFSYTGAMAAGLTGSTNWGMDFYVRPETLPNGTSLLEVGLVHFGGTSGNSLAIELAQHPTWAGGTVNWMVHQPGVTNSNYNLAFGGVAPPIAGLWNHVVYVNNGGTGEFWVDGVKSTLAVPAVAGPSANGGLPGLAIGAMWNNYRRGLDGQMDEVRFFTFAPGQFNIADTVPEPSSSALVLLAAAGLLRRKR